VVGLGVGERHLNFLTKSKNIEIISVFDPDVKKLKKISKKYNTKSVNSFKKMSKVFNAPIDSRFVKTYFEPVFEMLYFTNVQDIGMYKALAKELSLEVNPFVLDGSARISDLVGNQRKNNLFVAALSDELKQSVALHVKEEMSTYENKEG
jgi:hypothetical protein